MKLVQFLGSVFVQSGSWLVELPRLAKALRHQSNPCFSHNQEVCPAVSAIESMLGNLQPLSADLQSATGTTTRKTG